MNYYITPSHHTIQEARLALPENGQARLSDLEHRRSNYFAKETARQERINELRARKNEALDSIAHFDRSVRGANSIDPADQAQRNRWEQQAQELAKETRRLSDAPPAPNTPAVDTVLEFVAKAPPGAYVDTPVPLDRQPTLSGLSEQQGRVKALKIEQLRVRGAHVPLARAKELAERQIKTKAAAGAMDFATCLRRKVNAHGRVLTDGPDWPTKFIAGALIDQSNGLIAALFEDRLIAYAHAQIDAAYDPDKALDDAARTARLAELDAEILEAERIEAAIAFAIPESTIRPDMSVEALLGIARDPQFKPGTEI
jgi:hypothetical protein